MSELPSEQIKLIVLDVDGTLLNAQKQITPRTLSAIQAAREAGIIVTLATARRYGNTREFAEVLGIDIPLIICDGALIIQHPDFTVLHTHRLSAETAQRVVEMMVEQRVQPVVHHIRDSVEETWTGHPEFDNPELAIYFQNFPSRYNLPHTTLCLEQPDPLRVVAFASEEAINALIPVISTLPCTWYTIKKGLYGCAEIVVMHEDCSKAMGVTALARQLGIPLAQVMAIGDGVNDIPMLQVAGWGVAMGQASDSVKSVAHAVTTSNGEDGVALAIERYALRSERNVLSNSSKRATCL